MLDLPFKVVCLLVTSFSAGLHNCRSMTVIWPSANTMFSISESIMVVEYLFLTAIHCQLQTIFIDTEQTTIHSRPNGISLGRYGVINIRAE
jgi:hypothetical protein